MFSVGCKCFRLVTYFLTASVLQPQVRVLGGHSSWDSSSGLELLLSELPSSSLLFHSLLLLPLCLVFFLPDVAILIGSKI